MDLRFAVEQLLDDEPVRDMRGEGQDDGAFDPALAANSDR